MRNWARAGLFLAVLARAAPPGNVHNVEFTPLSPQVIQQRLELVPRKQADRRTVLTALFHEVGCDQDNLVEQPIRHSKQPNLVRTLPGGDGHDIIVGGHYDSIEIGMGAVDDWSGVALLPSLYQSLREKPRRHRFLFIGFAGEETGLLGSHSYVRGLARDTGRIGAMINLECLGLGPPNVWASRANPRLLNAYVVMAKTMHLQARGINADNVGDDDSHPFLDAGIPVLSIHSITSDTLSILHGKRDNLTAIRADDYYTAYRLAAAYLAYLDEALE